MKHNKSFSALNIVVIGCGNWGKNHVRVLHELGALAGICDANATTTAALSARFNVPEYTLNELIQDPNIDGVIIATPVDSHHDLAIACLQAGKHVFVEKPIAMTVAQAKRIHDQAKLSKKTLMVGHLLHYHAAFKKLKAMCQAGELGNLQYVYSNRLNLGKYRTEENIWWSFAPHDVSMILSLMGEMPESVMAMGAKYLMHTASDVTCTHLSFTKGQQAHIFVSWLHPYKEQKLVVVGEKAMAIFDDSQPWASKLKLHPYPSEWVDGLPKPSQSDAIAITLEDSEPLKDEAKHFLKCIQENAQPLTDGSEAIRVLKILSAAECAIEQHRPVYMSQFNKTHGADKERDYFAHETVTLDPGAHVGSATKIWHYSHVLPGSDIGPNCSIGQNCAIGPNVTVGKGCKIQNNVSVYEGVTLEEEVFVGPSAVFTNINVPRAFLNQKRAFSPTLVKKGATIGANATILCGHTLGKYSFIAAGSVVTQDVPDYALMAGNPAKQIGWISKDGKKVMDEPKDSQTKNTMREEAIET